MRKTEIEEKNMTDINKMENGPMLNLYPDSLGGDLEAVADLFERDGFADAFSSIYILPSIYHSDLDRGFSVIDYDLEETFHSEKALLRFAEEHRIQILLIRLYIAVFCHFSAVFPECIPVNKKVTIFRLTAILQQILELWRLYRRMV